MRWALMALGGVAVTSAAACSSPHCLDGGRCEEVRPCATIAIECGSPSLFVGRVADAPGGIGLAGAEGVAGDLVLRNDQVTVVIDALDTPHDLASTGGSILDFGPNGGADDVMLIYQVAGILPDDALAYDSVELVDRSPELVAVILRGSLDGRPDVEVATRYEMRPCEPGVRVRSELRNRTPDIQAWMLADLAHWGKRSVLPFAPLAAQGFVQPELDLIEIDDSWFSFSFVAARAATVDGPTYGFVGCSVDRIEGVNDPEISALGTARTLVRPGEGLVYERFLSATPGPDLETGARTLGELRAMLRGVPDPIAIRGRVVAGGIGFGGDVRRASLIVYEDVGGARVPLTQLVPAADGTFAASVRASGALSYELWSFGRPVASASVSAGVDVDLGDVAVTTPATVTLQVTDGQGTALHATVSVHPADESTRAAVTGSWHGRFGDCAPWLGPPHGASPACNRVLVPLTGVDVEVPPGRYWFYASAGPERSIARVELALAEAAVESVDLALVPMPVAPGMLSADLHVHGRRSFDSGLPDPDRVRSFVAAGVQVIAATDHDYVTDYREAVNDLGLGGEVFVIGGLETTQLIPWMAVPGDDFPRVIGHYNFWPLAPSATAARGGAPWDERIEPGELFDRLAPLTGPDGVAQMNHPWASPQSGRDLGYLRAIKFDPRLPIPESDDGTRQGMLRRRPAQGRSNLEFDLIEVINGAGIAHCLQVRPLWFSLLSQGIVRSGTASSDSHSLSDAQLGYGRTYVAAATALPAVDVAELNRALRAGAAVGTTGPYVEVSLGPPGGATTSVSSAPYQPGANDVLRIEVRAAPWIPVTEVRAVTSAGVRVVATAADLSAPDPLSTDLADLVRYTAEIPIADLIGNGADDWIVIEAGMPLPISADLDDDGVPDTSDNNGDGVVDFLDVEEGEDAGPLLDPADPTDEADPRFFLTRIVPGAYPYAFANPILIDWAGDGWQPPGLQGGS